MRLKCSPEWPGTRFLPIEKMEEYAWEVLVYRNYNTWVTRFAPTTFRGSSYLESMGWCDVSSSRDFWEPWILKVAWEGWRGTTYMIKQWDCEDTPAPVEHGTLDLICGCFNSRPFDLGHCWNELVFLLFWKPVQLNSVGFFLESRDIVPDTPCVRFRIALWARLPALLNNFALMACPPSSRPSGIQFGTLIEMRAFIALLSRPTYVPYMYGKDISHWGSLIKYFCLQILCSISASSSSQGLSQPSTQTTQYLRADTPNNATPITSKSQLNPKAVCALSVVRVFVGLMYQCVTCVKVGLIFDFVFLAHWVKKKLGYLK